MTGARATACSTAVDSLLLGFPHSAYNVLEASIFKLWIDHQVGVFNVTTIYRSVIENLVHGHWLILQRISWHSLRHWATMQALTPDLQEQMNRDHFQNCCVLRHFLTS